MSLAGIAEGGKRSLFLDDIYKFGSLTTKGTENINNDWDESFTGSCGLFGLLLLLSTSLSREELTWFQVSIGWGKGERGGEVNVDGLARQKEFGVRDK